MIAVETARNRALQIAATAVLLFPATAVANGGAPLLLVVNAMAFLYGGLAIVLVEFGMYVWLAKIPARRAFVDALLVNLCSTIVIGLMFPALIGGIALIGANLPGEAGKLSMALGTWIFDGVSYPRLTFAATIAWLSITYILTVHFEARLLALRWENRFDDPPITAMALNWIVNTITYVGLLIFLIVAFAPTLL